MIYINYIKKSVHSKRSTDTFVMLLFISVFILYFAYPSFTAACSKEAVLLCINTLIPSLFPFFVIGKFVIESGASFLLSDCIGRLFSFVFSSPETLCAPYIIGIISGFPAGGKSVIELYEKGLCTKKEAEKALAFCNNTGPAFAVGAVGAMLGNIRSAVIIFLLQIPCSVIAARIFSARKTNTKIKQVHNPCNAFDSFCKSVTSSVLPMATVCAFVIVFAPVSGFIRILLKYLSAPKLIIAVVLCLTEISSGVKYASSLSGNTAFIICAFAVCFSGISVILQLTSLSQKHGLSMKYCFFGKLLQGVLGGLFAYLISLARF